MGGADGEEGGLTMFEPDRPPTAGKNSDKCKNIQLKRWSNKSEDLAVPLPIAVLQHLGITGPCTITAERVGKTLILKKKGSPNAWQMAIDETAV